MGTTRTGHGVTRLAAVPYDTYVQIRDAPANRGYRMAYHDGVLEIMSPEFAHERAGRRLGVLVLACRAAFQLACEPAGATAFRKGRPGRLEGKGKEPDESFYLGDAAARLRGRDALDLAIDPPPSLWIEVDDRASSRARLPLYAALGVPEVWRYRPSTRRLWFGRLTQHGYEPLDASLALPGLTPALVLDLLAEAGSRDASAWDRWLREVWFPAHRQELLDRGAGR